MRCCTKQQKTKRSGLKVLSRLACKLEFPCVCDLRKHVHNGERKYVADHWCACCRNALSMASVTMNMCASVSVSWGMCLHVWDQVRGPLPFIWASCDVRCCVQWWELRTGLRLSKPFDSCRKAYKFPCCVLLDLLVQSFCTPESHANLKKHSFYTPYRQEIIQQWGWKSAQAYCVPTQEIDKELFKCSYEEWYQS